MTFRAVLLTQEERTVTAEVTQLEDAQLPDGEVTVDILQHAQLQGWNDPQRRRSPGA